VLHHELVHTHEGIHPINVLCIMYIFIRTRDEERASEQQERRKGIQLENMREKAKEGGGGGSNRGSGNCR
jgi:hypothetical protein